jgi:hypothetical protein
VAGSGPFKGNFDLTIINHVEPLDYATYADPNYYFGYDSAKAFRDLVATLPRPAACASAAACGATAAQLAEDAVNAFIWNPAQVAVFKRGLKGCGTARRSSPTTSPRCRGPRRSEAGRASTPQPGVDGLTHAWATFARMASPDPRGNPCGTRNAAARDAADSALWRMMSFYDTPLADLDAASAHDPGWALPHVMRAGFLLSLTEASLLSQARRSTCSRARAASPARRHASAATSRRCRPWLEGRWQAACRSWDELLVEYPAMRWRCSGRSCGTSTAATPSTCARGRRAHCPSGTKRSAVRACAGLHAFGLEECNLYPQAEEVGRRALALNPRCRGPCMRWRT